MTAPAPRPAPGRYRASVAVVGAGQAGLVAARELLKQGHSVTVFESGPSVGGTWVVSPTLDSDPLALDPDRTRVHSSM
jgi:cation diffusion facilitator CzcD-associated flavoprotein CzcO